uniref:Glycoside hydrolase family 5 domain-containing protein n=1 Tax=Ditylenchus dipsaci TaxID=166011 RepID=A0A915CY58_9BILA
MDKAQTAINNKLPLIFTELGTTAADGDGPICKDWTQKWWDFVNKNKISYLNWSLVNKAEGSAALKPGTQPTEAEECKESNLTPSGLLVRNELKTHDNGVTC